jgi:Zn-finger nucleic acid-binding protein
MTAICLGCGATVADGTSCLCVHVSAPRDAPRMDRDGPYRDAQGEASVRCPRDDRPLVEVDVAGTPLDECDRCGGAFVEGWVLDRLIEAREARISLSIALPARRVVWEREVRYLRCPRCRATMNRKLFGLGSGVVVDICKRCGVWFDAGELSQVLAYVESGGLERHERRKAEERAEEKRRERVRREAAALEPPERAGRRDQHDPGFAIDLLDAILGWWRS